MLCEKCELWADVPPAEVPSVDGLLYAAFLVEEDEAG